MAEKKKEKKKPVWLHNTVYRTMRNIFAKMFLSKYSWTTTVAPKTEEPCIVMSNHTTEADWFMLGSACPTPMYYVAGEHLLRSKAAGLLKTFVDPIFVPRGGSPMGMIREVVARIKAGHNIMIFPEGCRSFDGETLPVHESTAKMVKLAKCGLITYRVHGGYFVAPRWGHKFRRGPVHGEVMHVYSSQELAEMSPAEIKAAIDRDLYVNAYAEQRENPRKYECEAPAEGLENYLIICPKCGSYDSMETKGNAFRCTCCGTGGIYDEYGFLKGEGLAYDNVYDWGKWMQKRFDEDMDRRDREDPEGLRFTDTDVRLYEICPDHTTRDISAGEIRIYRDRFETGGHTFDFARISNASLLYFGKSILFTHADGYFGITGEHFHAWKGSRLYERYKGI